VGARHDYRLSPCTAALVIAAMIVSKILLVVLAAALKLAHLLLVGALSSFLAGRLAPGDLAILKVT
jgi:hypothetical protein